LLLLVSAVLLFIVLLFSVIFCSVHTLLAL